MFSAAAERRDLSPDLIEDGRRSAKRSARDGHAGMFLLVTCSHNPRIDAKVRGRVRRYNHG